jgi:hypothetical protein
LLEIRWTLKAVLKEIDPYLSSTLNPMKEVSEASQFPDLKLAQFGHFMALND